VTIGALVSIHGDREYPLELAVPYRLDLQFDDVPAPEPSDPLSVYRDILRKRSDEEVGLKRQPPTVDDAQAIIDFASSIKDISGIVLCHCGGGVSRAPAAALLCLAAWTGPGDEQHCMEYLLTIRACASPHMDLVRFGDQLLGRSGRLVAAIQ
jgi:predicted protein tyrosine phosphatase